MTSNNIRMTVLKRKIQWLTKGRHITFKIVMFHVKLSTDFCSFLSFRPSLAPILCRFSWNSIAVENKRGINIVSILVHFCDHRESNLKLIWKKDSEKASEILFFKHKSIWCRKMQCHTTCQYIQISPSQNPLKHLLGHCYPKMEPSK